MMMQKNVNPIIIALMAIMSIKGNQAQSGDEYQYNRPTKSNSIINTTPIATILPIGSATEVKGPNDKSGSSSAISPIGIILPIDSKIKSITTEPKKSESSRNETTTTLPSESAVKTKKTSSVVFTTTGTPSPSESIENSSKSVTSVSTTTTLVTKLESHPSDGTNHSGTLAPSSLSSFKNNDKYSHPLTSWTVGTPIFTTANPSDSSTAASGSPSDTTSVPEEKKTKPSTSLGVTNPSNTTSKITINPSITTTDIISNSGDEYSYKKPKTSSTTGDGKTTTVPEKTSPLITETGSTVGDSKTSSVAEPSSPATSTTASAPTTSNVTSTPSVSISGAATSSSTTNIFDPKSSYQKPKDEKSKIDEAKFVEWLQKWYSGNYKENP